MLVCNDVGEASLKVGPGIMARIAVVVRGTPYFLVK